LTLQFPEIKQEITQALENVFKTQQFILGPNVEAFEGKIASYIGSKYAVGVSSGTDALLIALMAMGIKQGDEVIVPTFSFFATAGVVCRLGARPVFVDLEPETFNINPNHIRARISENTRAIIPVHLFGQCAAMKDICEVSAKHNIHVIEDVAQALGAENAGKKAGSIGTMGCFSFFPTKNLGGMGDSGMVTTDIEEYAIKLKLLRVHGSGSGGYIHRIVGGNFRLDEIQAAMLLVKFKHLEKWIEKRRKNASNYFTLFNEFKLDGYVKLPKEIPGNLHTYNQFVIRVDKRDELRNYLLTRGIGNTIYYPLPLHLQECFIKLGYKKGDFPDSEKTCNEVVALPVYPELKMEDQEYVVEKIAKFYLAE
jgi:dTDP-4-amino-4,6-dideoxygalactose transaminase